ncbi:MAG: hypothetical protein ACRD2E_03185 [Terriglobales bacterium]
MARLRALVTCLAAAALALGAAAQTQSIAAIKVTGSRRFSQAAVIRASGLHVGEAFSPATASQAVDTLTATGAFAHIAYLFFPVANGVEVDLRLQDSVRFAPAEFDNFVWYTAAELNSALALALPLYTGQVPADGGGLDDAVVRQLERLLAARGIHAQVQYVAGVGGAGRGAEVQFSIVGLTVPVTTITFPGAAPALQTALAAAVASSLGSNFSQEVAEGWALGPARGVYLSRGYLDAGLGPPQVTVHPGATLSVAVALPVNAGPLFHLGGIAVTVPNGLAPGLTAAAAAQRFAGVVPAAARTPGTVVNTPLLAEGAAAVTGLCHRYGYFSAHVSLVPALDRQRQVATYHLTISAGPRYAMGQLVIEGWPDGVTARLRSRWTMATGQPYDGTYLRHFLVEASAVLKGGVVFMETAHPLTRTVDVTIRPGA